MFAGSFPLPQLPPQDLARGRQGEFVDELDFPRILVPRQGVFHESLDIRLEGVVGCRTWAEFDECFDDIAAQLVRRGYDCGHSDRLVPLQRPLDLRRPDAMSGADNDIVGAPLEPKIPVGILY